MMENGKLYQTKDLYWFLYPSKDIATAADRQGACNALYARIAAASNVDFWGRKLNCNISFIYPKSMFMLLEQDIRHCKVLTAERNIGWICLAEWCSNDIEEVKAE